MADAGSGIRGSVASRLRRVVFRVLLSGMAFGVLITAVASADEFRLSEIRTRIQPAGTLSSLGPDWQQVPRAEWETLVDRLRLVQLSPRPVSVERAEYHATFAGEELRGGRFDWQIRKPGRQPEWLAFGDSNLAITELTRRKTSPNQDAAEVVWGTTADGHVVARTDADGETLSGRWTLRGRPTGRRIRFHLKLIPATASQLHIRLPEGWRLSSDVGTVTQPVQAAGQTGAIWTVHVSSLHSVRLTVQPPEPTETPRPVRLVNTDTVYVVRDNGLRIQFQADYEVLHAPIHQVEFRLPNEVTVHSVNYGGTQPLSFKIHPAGAEQRLVVTLPDPLLGRSRGFTLQAVAPVSLAKQWVLPRLVPEATVFVEGQVHLRLENPVVLEGLKPTGLRQVAALSRSQTGEVLSFAQEHADARLQIETSLPKADVSCRTVSRLDDQGERWQVATEIQWTVSRGVLYSARCRIPQGWSVSSVQLQPTTAEGTPRELTWTEYRDRMGVSGLTIDFPSAITVGESATVIIKATRSPGGRRRVKYPVFSPDRVQKLESAVLIVPRDPSDRIPVTPPIFWRMAAHQIPRFVKDSALWRTKVTPDGVAPVVLFSRSLSASRSFLLDSAESTFDARVWTQLEIHNQELRERLALHVEPTGNDLKSILLLFSQNGSPPGWPAARFADGSRVPISARRLDAARHPGLAVPPAGELWELTFPQVMRKPFDLQIARVHGLRGEMRPPLVSFPHARRFTGFVEFAPPEFVTVETTDLFPITDVESVRPHRPEWPATAANRKNITLYQYRSSKGDLLIRHKQPNALTTVARPISCKLQSVLSFGEGRKDGHLATFQFAAEPVPRSFPLSLRAPAAITAIQVDGRDVISEREGDRVLLPVLEPNRPHRVVVRYETPSVKAGWQTRATVIVPRSGITAFDFRWRFAVAPEVGIVAQPEQTRLTPGPDKVPWSRKVFGPLGRNPETRPFNPLSADDWTSKLFGKVGDDVPAALDGDLSWAPAGWTVYQAIGPRLPDELTLEVTNRNTLWHWSWIFLLTTVAAGWWLRRHRFEARRRLGGIWVSLCLAAAFSLPDHVAVCAGGCLVGSLIVTLLPRRVIRAESVPDQSVAGIPVGSTLSYPRISSISSPLIVLAALLGSSVVLYGQNADTKAPAKTTIAGTTDRDVNVLIPEVDTADGSTNPQSVYVRHTLLNRARQAARVNRIGAVIRQADYRVTRVSLNSADVTARWEVVIVSPEPQVTLFLPIRDAPLCGANACRVNGRVSPVRRSPDGSGFVLDWTRPSTAGRLAEGTVMTAAVGSAGLAGGEPSVVSTPETLSVELCLQVPIAVLPDSALLSFGIPRVPFSRLELRDTRQGFDVRVDDLTAQSVEHGWFSRTLRGTIGGSPRLQVAWGTRDAQTSRPVELIADINSLVDIQPAAVHIHDRVSYEVVTGTAEILTWTIPPGWILRSVRGTDPATNTDVGISVASRRNGRIVLELDAPRKTPFVVTAEFLMPMKTASRSLSLAVPRRHDATKKKGRNRAVVRPRSHRVGFSTSGDYELDVKPGTTAVAPILELQEREELRSLFPNRRSPEFAYAVQNPTVFKTSLIARRTRRTVEVTQTGFVQRDLLSWTYSANVATAAASTFHHELVVDPRLKIDSVAVMEDDAPRLLRWSRIGDRLHLYLSDKTSGTQQVLIQGEMPLRYHTDWRLPELSMQSADVTSSRVLLFRDPSVGVTVSQQPPENRIPFRALPPTPTAIFVSAFSADSSSPPPVLRTSPRSSTLRAERFTAVNRTTAEGRTLSLDVTLKFTDDLPPSVYAVHMPKELVPEIQFDRTLWTVTTHDLPDGSSDWIFQPNLPGETIPPLFLQARWRTPAGDKWPIPLPTPRSATLRTDVLAVTDARRRLQPDGPAETVKEADLPPWMKRPPSRPETVFYRNRQNGWRLFDSPGQSPDHQPRVALMETRLWTGQYKADFGRTRYYLTGLSRGTVPLDWPPSLSLESVRVDGRTVSAVPDVEGTLTLRVGEGSTHIIQVDWSHEPERGFLGFAKQTLVLPRPSGVTVELALLTMTPVAGRTATSFAGWNVLDVVPYTIVRLEQLLRIASLPAIDDIAVAAAFQAASDTNNQLSAYLKRQDSERAELDPETAQILGQLTDRIEELRARFDPSILQPLLPTAPNDRSDVAFLPDSELAGRLDTTGEQLAVSYRLISSPLLWTLIAVVAVLIAIPMTRLLYRVHIGDRFAGWEPLSWGALGIIWWLYLIPSLCGLLLLIVAAGITARNWIRHYRNGGIIRVYDHSKIG